MAMAIGQINRILKRKSPKKVPLNVPQLVNSSLTIFLGTYHPKKRQVKKLPTGRRICPVTKSKRLNNDFPNSCKSSHAPNDKEQNAPMTAQLNVTIIAARLRVRWNSSWINAVHTSCKEMSDVSAANAKSA